MTDKSVPQEKYCIYPSENWLSEINAMHLQDAFKIISVGGNILACEVIPAADSEEIITTINNKQ